MPSRCPHCHRPLDAPGSEPEDPRSGGGTFGRFTLTALLARSPFGTARYRAHDPYLDRPVTLTLLHAAVRGAGRDIDRLLRAGPPSGYEALDHFRRQARLLARLHHPAIPPVHEVGSVDDRPDLVTRFVAGRSLAEVGRDGPFPPRDAARLVAAVVDAVQHTHEQGVVPRDLRPGTILVDEQGRPHLTDFARARLEREADGAGEELIWGNPAHVSPERLRGAGPRPDRRCDVYGLGLVLYELLTGRLLYPTEPVPEAVRHKLEGEPKPPRAPSRRIDRDLEAICLRALARDPDRRYPTAAALAEDLRRSRAGRPIGSRSRWPWPWSRR